MTEARIKVWRLFVATQGGDDNVSDPKQRMCKKRGRFLAYFEGTDNSMWMWDGREKEQLRMIQ